MPKYYYLTDDRQTRGPIGLEELSSLLQQGTIRSDTLVAREGDPGWRPFSEIAPSAAPSHLASQGQPPGFPPSHPAPISGAAMPYQAPAYAGGYAPARKRGCGPCLWISVGCLGLLIMSVLGIGAIGFIAFSALRDSAPYKEALAQAQHNRQAVEVMGEPIEARWMPMGGINLQGTSSASASLVIFVGGPKSSGMITVEAQKREEHWTYQKMELSTFSPSTTIDLRPSVNPLE